MKISVIIPTYKPGDYLFTCLRSVYHQSMKASDFEVLLILNGCSEPYSSEINNFIDEYNFLNLRLVQSDEKGVSAARNKGIELSQGDYICFIDDDDYVSNTYLEDLYSSISSNSISICSLKCFNDSKDDRLYDDYITKNYNYLSKHCQHRVSIIKARHFFSNPVCKLVPRVIAQRSRFNKSLYLGEDGLYFFSISQYVKNIKLAPSSAVYYRRVRDNSSSRKVSYELKINQLLSLFRQYLLTWSKSPFKFNLIFFITRLAAVIYYIMINFKGLLQIKLSKSV